MPSYCEGIMEISGSKEAIVHFLKDQYSILPNTTHTTITECKDHIDIKTDKQNIHLRLTSHGYLTDSRVEYNFDQKSLSLNYMQARDIKTLEFKFIAVKYNLDIKVLAYNPINEFSRCIIIQHGHVIKDTTDLKEYRWDLY